MMKNTNLFQITIKEMILKFIPKRIATFRLCPSTKVSKKKLEKMLVAVPTILCLQFHFLPPSNLQTSGQVFIIDDGSQPKIELSSKDRNVIAATFTHFLLKNIGGSETFKDKQDFFYHEVCVSHTFMTLGTTPTTKQNARFRCGNSTQTITMRNCR